jgi:hypothetical protein
MNIMGEPKPLASLSAGLLARKGGARPAMRRQPLGSGPAPVAGPGYDDLGWNDMGYDVDPDQTTEAVRMVDLKPLLAGSVLAPDASVDNGPLVDDKIAEESVASEAASIPEVVRQQESLLDRVAAVARKVEERPAARKTPKAAGGVRMRDKAAFTLRLDAERHLRLRLASAVTNRSAQIILTELLDDYLASLPEIDAMASRVPAAPARRAARS